MSELIIDSPADHVELWTLNRPKARNAVTSTLARRLLAEFDRAEKDDKVHAVVLTGAGKGFCAGLDLAEFSAPGAPRGLVGEAISRARSFAKPLLGAINGAAVTGGLELALACDILLASPNAVFRDTHLRIGAMSGSGMSVYLPRAVGRSWARRMILANDPMQVDVALRLGLISEIVSAEELIQTSVDLAGRIAAMDEALASTTKQLCDAVDRTTPATGLELEAAALIEHRKSNQKWSTP